MLVNSVNTISIIRIKNFMQNSLILCFFLSINLIKFSREDNQIRTYNYILQQCVQPNYVNFHLAKHVLFQLRSLSNFNLTTGECSLFHLTPAADEKKNNFCSSPFATAAN